MIDGLLTHEILLERKYPYDARNGDTSYVLHFVYPESISTV